MNMSVDHQINPAWVPQRELTQEESKIVISTLGWNGAMVGGSKSYYREKHPKNEVIFNSNICTDETKVWYGDIDVTKSKKQLIKLSKELGKKLYILYEMDGRFENANNPRLDKARVVVDGSNIIVAHTVGYDEQFNKITKYLPLGDKELED